MLNCNMCDNVQMRDGKKIFVRVIGKGKPVVLLHGFGMDSRHWIPFILPFINTYQFIVPDFRGFGKSSYVPINNLCVFTNYCEDFEDILDYYNVDTVSLVGVSMGAYISLFYLSNKGTSRADKFLCIDQSPSFKNTDDYQFGIGLVYHEEWMSDFRNILNMIENHIDEKKFSSLPADIRNYAISIFSNFLSASFSNRFLKILIRSLIKIPCIQNIFMPPKWASYFQVLKAYMDNDYNLTDKIHKINIKTTVMVGMLSEMYPFESSTYIHKQIKESKLIKFEKSGHTLMMSEPIKFMVELNRFLSI